MKRTSLAVIAMLLAPAGTTKLNGTTSCPASMAQLTQPSDMGMNGAMMNTNGGGRRGPDPMTMEIVNGIINELQQVGQELQREKENLARTIGQAYNMEDDTLRVLEVQADPSLQYDRNFVADMIIAEYKDFVDMLSQNREEVAQNGPEEIGRFVNNMGRSIGLAQASETECAPGCPTSWISDGHCEDACNVAACDFDGTDCTESPADDAALIAATVAATTAAANAASTEQCAPGCPPGWPGDNYCDDACNNAACNFDNGDCDGTTMTEADAAATTQAMMDAQAVLDAAMATEMQMNLGESGYMTTYDSFQDQNLPTDADGCLLPMDNNSTMADYGPPMAEGYYTGTMTGNMTVGEGWTATPPMECASGCPTSWLADGMCDSACNNAACNFDNGDCADTPPRCAPECPPNWLADGMCDENCNNAACNYDDGDCTGQPANDAVPATTTDGTNGQCAPNCPPQWLADGMCDDACNNASCNFDNGDCAGIPPSMTGPMDDDCMPGSQGPPTMNPSDYCMGGPGNNDVNCQILMMLPPPDMILEQWGNALRDIDHTFSNAEGSDMHGVQVASEITIFNQMLTQEAERLGVPLPPQGLPNPDAMVAKINEVIAAVGTKTEQYYPEIQNAISQTEMYIAMNIATLYGTLARIANDNGANVDVNSLPSGPEEAKDLGLGVLNAIQMFNTDGGLQNYYRDIAGMLRQVGVPSDVLPPAEAAQSMINQLINEGKRELSPQCAPGCPAGWPGDGYCDSACNNAACNFDNGDCDEEAKTAVAALVAATAAANAATTAGITGECAPGCPPTCPGDGFCDPACNNAACNWDGGDCAGEQSANDAAMAATVAATAAANAATAAAANAATTAALTGECAPGCPSTCPGDGVCDPLCNNAACAFDGGDCDTV